MLDRFAFRFRNGCTCVQRVGVWKLYVENSVLLIWALLAGDEFMVSGF